MQRLPIQYIEPVFRPPSEAESLILPITNGCSWNRCTFCEMYTEPQKAFRPRDNDQVLREIEATAQRLPAVRRIFLADGDAMVLSVRRLADILEALNRHFPNLQRVSSYCLPRNLKNKSVAELATLRALKLDLLYVGAETGDDHLLTLVRKGETQASTIDALLKIKSAGIRSSVMILNGLGGKAYSRQHALHSADLVNATQPEYLSTLVVSFPRGQRRLLEHFPDFQELTQSELFLEMKWFIERTRLTSSVFRSDHASNYLVLKGILGRDKQSLLDRIEHALALPGEAGLRKEWQRGL